MTTPGDLTLRDLVSGPARFRAVTAWGPAGAIVALVAMALVIAVLQIGSLGVAARLIGEDEYNRQIATGTLAAPIMLLSTLMTQIPLIAMLWIAADRAGLRAETLQLAQRPLGWGASLVAGGALVAALALLQVGLHAAVPGYDLTQEARSFAAGLNSPLWWGTVLAIGVLAPVSEELLARGFLLTALSNSRLGVAGGGLISNVLWTSLHFQYSWGSLLTVFCGGLALTWLVWRTGSLRAAIVAHMVVNATVLGYLAAFSGA